MQDREFPPIWSIELLEEIIYIEEQKLSVLKRLLDYKKKNKLRDNLGDEKAS
jgi:hypothetical protein